MRRIAVLTSGGDAPGMNACIRSVVRYGLAAGLQVYGVRQGYRGLIDNQIFPLDSRAVSGILRAGGTILMSARSQEFHTEAGQCRAIEVLRGWDIDGLVVIGGDGSLRGALELHRKGFPVVGVPASIDNDIACTEMSIGVDTALNTILEAVDRIKDTAAALQRAFVIEVMGRSHGYLALMAGIAGGAEMVVLPGTQVDRDKVVDEVRSAFLRGKPHFIIVAAEGASSAEKSISQLLSEYVQASGHEVRTTVLGHVQRGGSPTCYDRLLGTRLGAAAVDCLLKGKSGVMVGIQSGEIAVTDLETVLSAAPELSKEALRLSEPLAH
ncbi:MAG: 6-phosphofructokinase [Armatimonadota bacterium]|nr:6-phosphofructokinase [Armatimonadota bacterium]